MTSPAFMIGTVPDARTAPPAGRVGGSYGARHSADGFWWVQDGAHARRLLRQPQWRADRRAGASRGGSRAARSMTGFDAPDAVHRFGPYVAGASTSVTASSATASRTAAVRSGTTRHCSVCTE